METKQTKKTFSECKESREINVKMKVQNESIIMKNLVIKMDKIHI